MIIHNVAQRSPEWHELRRGKITGTDAGAKRETLVLKVLSQLTEDFYEEEEYQNFAMQRGSDLEQYAREEISSELFIDFQEVGFIQNDLIPIVGISPDGISPCRTIQLEIKSPSAKKHIETVLSDSIPLDNIDQCIHAFVVNNALERLIFVSYRPESNVKRLFYKELTLESMVNIGTNARPKLAKVADVVEELRNEYQSITTEVNDKMDILSGCTPRSVR